MTIDRPNVSKNGQSTGKLIPIDRHLVFLTETGASNLKIYFI